MSDKKRTVVVDTEGNGLRPTKMWCAVCIDVNTEEVFKFPTPTQDYSEFLKFAKTVDVWIGHNLIQYDCMRIFEPLLGLFIETDKIRDTLIMAKMYDVQYPGGHSIENFGRLFKHYKPSHENWDEYSEAMLHRCVEDTKINLKLYHWLLERKVKNGKDKEIPVLRSFSLLTEQRVRRAFCEQENLGLPLDVEYSQQFLLRLEKERDTLKAEIQEYFKPKPKPVPKADGEIVREPYIKQDGSMGTRGLACLGYENPLEVVGGPFSLFKIEPFNLDSPKQIVERLNEAGWKPTERTKGYRDLLRKKNQGKISKEEFETRQKYMWTVSEENLETIPDTAPEVIKKLAYWKLVSTRAQRVEEWVNLALEDGRVHGQVDNLGTKTHRCSHSKPNLGNVPSTKKPLGVEARKCFSVPKGKVMLGVDASSIQLCGLAHYIGDPRYIEITSQGKSHDEHAEILGVSRSTAKTYIYSFIMGAGDPKLGQIIGGSTRDGTDSRRLFVTRIPGLDKFIEKQKLDAKRGFIQGLDERIILVKNQREVMSKYLQSFEAVIMKHAMVGNTRGLTGYLKQFILDGVKARQIAHVHDEGQFECFDESNAKAAGEIVVSKFTEAGLTLGSRCPITGEAKFLNEAGIPATNWSETH